MERGHVRPHFLLQLEKEAGVEAGGGFRGMPLSQGGREPPVILRRQNWRREAAHCKPSFPDTPGDVEATAPAQSRAEPALEVEASRGQVCASALQSLPIAAWPRAGLSGTRWGLGKVPATAVKGTDSRQAWSSFLRRQGTSVMSRRSCYWLAENFKRELECIKRTH